MQSSVRLGLGVLVSLIAGAAAAQAPAPRDVLQTYCEPLIDGASAKELGDKARSAGFRDEVVGGQPMLRKDDLLFAVSDAPRVCFVQAPPSMTWQQGKDLVDAWASGKPGAMLSPTTTGPDGRPVKAWTLPSRKISLIATEQANVLGGKAINFIMMPMPAVVAK